MTKRPYDKPALTYTQQVDQLRTRGMEIADPQAAEFFLQHYNYYRLGAYWLPFEENHGLHKFKAGTKFEDVLNLYAFDRELRLLVMDAIERIEVSVRAQWAYRLGHLYGSHGYLNEALAYKKFRLEKHKEDLSKEIKRSNEVFVKHLLYTYEEEFPPIWAACEVMSLGLLSRWYENIKPMHVRSSISNTYGIGPDVLESWLHHLAIVRNICAHHSRLWDRSFSILPASPKSKPAYLAYEFVHSRRLYNSLVIMLHFMDVIAPHSDWSERLKQHLATENVSLKSMGFPENWKERPIWQEKGTK